MTSLGCSPTWISRLWCLMLKSTALAIATPVTLLCNLSISNGTVPGNWKISLIIPIHKQGDASNPGNYHPISLLSIISKVLERHIFEKLCEFVTISDKPVGFPTWQFHDRSRPLSCAWLAYQSGWWSWSAGCILWSAKSLWHCPPRQVNI